MHFSLFISLVLLISFTDLGLAKEANKDNQQVIQHKDRRAVEQPDLDSVNKRRKRDSLSSDIYKGSGEDGDDDDEGMLSPELSSNIRAMLSNPEIMQALYDRVNAEKDGYESDIEDEDADVDNGIFRSPYTSNGYAADDGDDDEDVAAAKRTRLFVGKRPRLFVGKRQREFVGKRRLFVGKRRLFVGKRRLFVGKRSQPEEKRQRLFVGKRSRLFVGKRQKDFIEKRDWQTNMQRRLLEFLEQKDKMGADFPKRFREFVGKRYGYLSNFQADKRPQRMFIGKRGDYAQMLRRAQDLMAKRTRLFVGKRQDEIVNNADADSQPGDQAQGFDGDKRSSRMFVGKRAAGADPYELIDKRHRYFVGKRAGLMEHEGDKEGTVIGAASSPKGDNFSDLKRSREFVGRR